MFFYLLRYGEKYQLLFYFFLYFIWLYIIYTMTAMMHIPIKIMISVVSGGSSSLGNLSPTSMFVVKVLISPFISNS